MDTSKNKKAAAEVAEEFKLKILAKRKENKIISMVPLLILVVLAVFLSLFVDGFFTYNNFISILYQISSPLVLSVGLTFVVILGSIDLSVEGVMGFTGSLVSLLVMNSKNPLDLGIWGILITVCIGSLTGVLTGVLHVKFKIPSFMVTFGMASVMTGFGVLTYMGRPASVRDPLFQYVSQGNFLGIPYLTWFSFVVFMTGLVIQKYTAFGRHIFAIGENEAVLRTTGVNVDKTKILVFTWSAFCSSVAGIFGALRLSRGEVTIGTGYLFTTITAVAVGGTALWGGKGGVLQSFVGVLIVVVIQSSMILQGVNPYIQSAIQGILIIFAVSFTVVRGKKIIIK